MNAQISVANVSVRQFDNLYSLNDLHKAAGGGCGAEGEPGCRQYGRNGGVQRLCLGKAGIKGGAGCLFCWAWGMITYPYISPLLPVNHGYNRL